MRNALRGDDETKLTQRDATDVRDDQPLSKHNNNKIPIILITNKQHYVVVGEPFLEVGIPHVFMEKPLSSVSTSTD